MCKVKSMLTVFFEEPFWVGIYEHEDYNKYEVCKITFGAEPKDYEVYDYIIKGCNKLRFSQPIETVAIAEKRVNPKRMQRTIKKQLNGTGVGTRAQQALKLQQEQGKLERKFRICQQKEEEKERRFELKQEKRSSKHKGH
jgi:hypothetical protein